MPKLKSGVKLKSGKKLKKAITPKKKKALPKGFTRLA